MRFIEEILKENGLSEPDFRPLHAYACTPDMLQHMQQFLAQRLASGTVVSSTANAFVFWASDRIRTAFDGGHLTWDFVFRGLGLPPDRKLGIDLTRRGLRMWRRRVRCSEAGQTLYLYTLMSEGGLPDTLLQQEGLYRQVVMTLVSEIEEMGGMAAEVAAEIAARRRIWALPQSFQTNDFVRVLADLGKALADLRTDLPEDLGPNALERWLDVNRPGWSVRLPIRLSAAARDSLIRPALAASKSSSTGGTEIATRELRRDRGGRWSGYIRLADEATLPEGLLPEASGLRLRLTPAQTRLASALAVVATPEDAGWRLRRVGQRGASAVPLAPDDPMILSAHADGRHVGDVTVLAALPAPEEAPTLWRAPAPDPEGFEGRLLPLDVSGRTTDTCAWLLTDPTHTIHSDGDVEIGNPEPGPSSGLIRRVSGFGSVRVGPHLLRVETQAQTERPAATLTATGKLLPRWRLPDGAMVILGEPRIIGDPGNGFPRPLRSDAVKRTPGRRLGGKIFEWREKDQPLARARLVQLPADTSVTIDETGAGVARLRISGLPVGWHVAVKAAGTVARGVTGSEPTELMLEAAQAGAGLVELQLHDPETGHSLDLSAPWPARHGLLLTPNGARVAEDTPVSVEDLAGWRGVTPTGKYGDLQFRLSGASAISVRVEGEVALAAYRTLIRSMLAIGGPDAQVNLRLIVASVESCRLEVRRYLHQTTVSDGRLYPGLQRDTPGKVDSRFGVILNSNGNITLHATDLGAPDADPVTLETMAPADLATCLDGVGPWLLQSHWNGAMQRAAVWARTPQPPSSRETRIENYKSAWKDLLNMPASPDWRANWRTIQSASAGGDAGALDQVQALARVPDALMFLAFRLPRNSLEDLFALETAAPIFWPATPVSAVQTAIALDHSRRIEQLSAIFDTPEEALTEAKAQLTGRLAEIVTMRSDLAGHLGAAAVQASLVELLQDERLSGLVIPNPRKRLETLAQEAARRFDRLPDGVRGVPPRWCPSGFAFNAYAQPIIEAPLTVAEIATETRPVPNKDTMLSLLALRMADPDYFDTAVPAAIALCLEALR
jgi:hypothetical protein